MSARFRWNAAKPAWEFYEPGFGAGDAGDGWHTMRRGSHVSTPPMTFAEGFRHIVTHHVFYGHEEGTAWVLPVLDGLNVHCVP